MQEQAKNNGRLGVKGKIRDAHLIDADGGRYLPALERPSEEFAETVELALSSVAKSIEKAVKEAAQQYIEDALNEDCYIFVKDGGDSFDVEKPLRVVVSLPFGDAEGNDPEWDQDIEAVLMYHLQYNAEEEGIERVKAIRNRLAYIVSGYDKLLEKRRKEANES